METTLESYRPLYHLTPAKGWINDPNGLCFFNGEWHAFYQHYHPTEADSMIWGHAVSSDLARWRRLPTAIGPDRHGQIWSGSAVVDHHDSSGLFGGKSGMVCLFTYWDKSDGRQAQGLAYSSDGRIFHKHPDNSVIPQLRYVPGHEDDKEFRDPKVFWNAERSRWIMVVAGGKLRIFSSADLIHWRFESIDESLITECPDLFPMHIDGDAKRRTWILSGGGRWYMLGDFDGRRFMPRSERIPFTNAPDFYAAQSFDNAPAGRRIMISWLHAWKYGQKHLATGVVHHMPTKPWSGGCLTAPYEICLRTTADGFRLMHRPVDELASLRVPAIELHDFQLSIGEHPLADIHSRALDIELKATLGKDTQLGLRIPAGGDAFYLVGYDASSGVLFVDRRNSGMEALPVFCERITTPMQLRENGTVSLRILLDSNSIEMFDRDGSAFLPATIFPDPAGPTLELLAQGGGCHIERLTVFKMAPAIE